jgi:protein arginine N-methyltransferase 5
MSYSDAMDESVPLFYIGQHETRRSLDVSGELVQHAQDLGYDMLTCPITNDHFHTRVLTLLSAYSQAAADTSAPQPLPLIPALENTDTPLGPSDTISQLLAYSSAWIDLSSPDPVIAHLSRQVFHLEVAYAAFCGAVNVVVPGPRLSHGQKGIAQYARAIKEALATGAYVQFHLLMPADGTTTADHGDVSDLHRFTRPEYQQETSAAEAWGSWDAWNTIRSVCNYHSRLAVGKNTHPLSTLHSARCCHVGVSYHSTQPNEYSP